MKLEHESADNLRRQILQIADKYLNLNKYKIFFFGSRVDGGENERSDIDLGIEGPERLPAKIFLGIKDEIESIPILYTIDLVDFKRVSPDFRQVAMRSVELL